MNPIYRGQYPPKNTDVLWIKGKKIFLFGTKGWEEVTENTIVDQELDPNSHHSISNSAVATVLNQTLNNAEDHLSETSDNFIKNKAVYNQYMDDEDTNDILDTLDLDPNLHKPLTFEVTQGVNTTISWGNSVAIKYNKNGEGWTTLQRNSTIPVSTGDVVQFMGNSDLRTMNSNPGFANTDCHYKVSGNIMSLIGGENFASLKTMGNSKFESLFQETILEDAFDLCLPATTLSEQCYSKMFYGCTSLQRAPKILPAPTLVDYCYAFMFYNCSYLSRIKCLATDISASSCMEIWLKNVFSAGIFIKKAEVAFPEGSSGIPTGWTIKNV